MIIKIFLVLKNKLNIITIYRRNAFIYIEIYFQFNQNKCYSHKLGIKQAMLIGEKRWGIESPS